MNKRQLRSGKDGYHMTTKQEREIVISMRDQGYTTLQIALQLGISEKTIKCIQKVERADKNGLFKFLIYRDYLNIFIENQKLIGLSDKKQERLIRKIIKSEFVYETSKYQFCWQRGKTSKGKRILEQVVVQIKRGFEQHFLQEIDQGCLEFYDGFDHISYDQDQNENTKQSFFDYIDCDFQLE